jgi:hypothetical protein
MNDRLVAGDSQVTVADVNATFQAQYIKFQAEYMTR